MRFLERGASPTSRFCVQTSGGEWEQGLSDLVRFGDCVLAPSLMLDKWLCRILPVLPLSTQDQDRYAVDKLSELRANVHLQIVAQVPDSPGLLSVRVNHYNVLAHPRAAKLNRPIAVNSQVRHVQHDPPSRGSGSR